MSEKTEPKALFQHSRERRATVLSTKKLSVNQRELLLNSGIGLVERNYISIIPVPFEVKELSPNIIFTSKNSVKAILDHPLRNEIQQKNIFCVGEKTAAFLKDKGFKVECYKNYGQELASEIIQDYSDRDFTFFCGKTRHDALPEALRNAGIDLSEVEVYDTRPEPKKIDRTFDGVMFFSPSAVRSYCKENELLESVVFCIGTTTSAEAEKHTKKIVVASKPSVESVVAQVVKYFKLQDKPFKNDKKRPLS